MFEHEDYLLYVVSAWCEMGWPAFKKAFDNLFIRYIFRDTDPLDSLSHYRRHTVRFLDSLGHCDVEFNESGGRIYSAAPLLARLPTIGLPQAVLCGSRTPHTLNLILKASREIGSQLKVDVQSQRSPRAYIPRRIVVQAESIEQIALLAKDLQINFSENPPSWMLLNFCGSLEQYLGTLEWSIQSELNWPRREYDLNRLQFVPSREIVNEFRLCSYEHPATSQLKHFLWQGERCALVDRDWARYATLNEANKSVIIYDPRNSLLIVPASVPLPRLVGRALTLCSGFAPQFIDRARIPIESPEQTGFDAYREVAPDIAYLAASRLGQSLIESLVDMPKEKKR